VRDPRAGAVVVFAGVTREVSHLDYEAYAEMAREQLEQIAATAIERHGLCRAAVEHRIGNVPLSEPSVVVAASAPHRGEAFAGAREIIDEVKARAPIWKREEGVEWVEGTPPAAEGDAVKLVRTGCAAISRLDAEACVAICDPDVEFESRITAVDDATYRGHDGVRRYIARLADAFDWLEITPLEVIEGDDRGVTVARFRARGRGSGVEVERRFFQAARLRDGRALWWGFFDSKDEALAAVGLRD
jgi:molybdopterin synthase catalytic subunit/ketosteroid isomerase-like protein